MPTDPMPIKRYLTILTQRRSALPVLVAVIMLVLGLHPQWAVWMPFDRQAILAGQWWRLLSAHWVHLSLAHALGNVAGGVLLWWLFAANFTLKNILATLITASLAVSLGLWFFNPEVEWYVGMSGVLHGFWALGAVGLWRSDRQLATLALLGLVIKLWAEWRFGSASSSVYLGGATVITAAHRFGALSGLLVAALSRLFKQSIPSNGESA
jgi:rhomboid family GlyGly-CTERM serine protease